MTSDGKYILSPMALLFPELSPSEFQQMVESIAQRGLQNPITRWRGQIIDGRHRYEACLLAGVEPRFQDLPDDANPLELVMDQNASRRHMSESQRAIAAHKLFEASSGDWAALGLPGVSANLQRFSLAAAAERFNVSRRSVSHAGKVTGRDSRAVPALQQAAEQGTVTVSDASRAVNQPPEIQLRALELVHRGTARTIAGAVKRVLQEISVRDPGRTWRPIYRSNSPTEWRCIVQRWETSTGWSMEKASMRSSPFHPRQRTPLRCCRTWPPLLPIP